MRTDHLPTGVGDRVVAARRARQGPNVRQERQCPADPVGILGLTGAQHLAGLPHSEAGVSGDRVVDVATSAHDSVTQHFEHGLNSSPTFFEYAVVKLLVAMGYGGAGGAANVTKQSGDGGIDGVIDQDALGLSRVYIQAKRYALDSPVGRPDLQAFVGALSGKADSGVFITTARFSAGAEAYAREIPARLILIDGARLVRLMIRYGVGVQVKDTYRVVEIDEDFFE